MAIDGPRKLCGHMSVSDLRGAIRVLRKHYRFISLDDAVGQLKSGTVKSDSIVLAFDDGFVDNYRHVLPVVTDLNVPATFYLATAVIGSSDSLWFQAVINWFYKYPGDHLYVGVNDATYDTSSPKRRITSAFSFMRYLQETYRPLEYKRIIEQSSNGLCRPDDLDRHLSWKEVRKLGSEVLVTIGSHTANHYRLSLCDDETARREIEESAEMLNKRLGTATMHFAYPRGNTEDFNDAHIEMLRQSGYASAVSTIRGVNRSDADLYRLKRIRLPKDTSKALPELLIAVAGARDLVTYAGTPFQRQQRQVNAADDTRDYE